MTYAMGKVLQEMENMALWVRNLITYSDLVEVANDRDVVTRRDIRRRLADMASERRDNR